MRSRYWSCSKFGAWLFKRAGVPKPTSDSFSGWANWKASAKEKAPLTYWTVEVAFDAVQDFFAWPSDFINSIRYYYRNRFSCKLHYLPTKLEPGKYYEFETRLLHGMFGALVDFVEVEKAGMNNSWNTETKKFSSSRKYWLWRWGQDRNPQAGLDYLNWEISLGKPQVDEHGNDMSVPSQAAAAQEQLDLYVWWTIKRPLRVDSYELSGLDKYYESKNDEEIFEMPNLDVWKPLHDKQEEIEKSYNLEDEMMMIRLVKLRECLWT